MTRRTSRDEAVDNAVAAVREAESYLRAGNTELSYSWSIIADTWAHVARAIDPMLDKTPGEVDDYKYDYEAS